MADEDTPPPSSRVVDESTPVADSVIVNGEQGNFEDIRPLWRMVQFCERALAANAPHISPTTSAALANAMAGTTLHLSHCAAHLRLGHG
jgi:hypothetical protein